MKKRVTTEVLIPEVMPAEIDLFRKYFYGSKRALVRSIANLIPPGSATVADLFGGTGVVSWFFKRNGYRVISNDIMRYPAVTLRALVANNHAILDAADLQMLTEANGAQDDYVQRFYTQTFGEANAAFLDTWAANVPKLASIEKRDLAIFALIAVITRHFHYAVIHWSLLGPPIGSESLRATDLQQDVTRYVMNELPRLIIDNGNQNQVFQEDAVELVRSIEVDVLYIDPPYASGAGQYESNYALLEDLVTILSGNGPLIKNPYDTRTELAPYTYFGTRNSALTGFAKLFERSRHIPTLIVSYNTTSSVTVSEIVAIAQVYRKSVSVQSIPRPLPSVNRNHRQGTEEALIVCNHEGGLAA